MQPYFLAKLITITALLFAATAVPAQTGWKWAVGSDVYGISGADIETWPTVTDRGGNVFLSGIITGWADSAAFGPYRLFNPYHYTQMVIAKVDSSGNYQWAIGSQGTNVFPVSMATDQDGNLFLLGKYENLHCIIGSDTLTDTFHSVMCFLVKITPSGAVAWARNVAPQSNGGGLGIDSTGSVYVSGSFYTAGISIGGTTLLNTDPAGGTSGYGGSADVYIAKFDSLGNTLWARSFGGDTTDYPRAMAVSGNGTIYISGHFCSPTLHAGTHTLTNASSAGTRANFLVRFDSNGNCDWMRGMNEHIDVGAMATNSRESIFMAGSIDTSIVDGVHYLYHQGRLDAYLAKYSADGNPVWSRSAGGNKYDVVNSISIDLCGTIWISGQMSSVNGISGYSMIFGSYTLHEPPWSYDPMFIARYDTSGAYHGSIALPSGGDDESGVSVDNRGNVYVGGDLQVPMTFGTDVLLPAGHEIGFIAKYKYDSVLCHSQVVLGAGATEEQSNGIMVFPNPATNDCRITCGTSFPAGATVEFFDITGRHIITYSLTGTCSLVPLDGLSTGLYQCRITAGNLCVVRKLAVVK